MYCVQLLVSPRAFLRDENNPSFIASRIDVISGCSLHGKSVCQYEDDHTQYEKLLPKLELVHFITQVEDENKDRNFVPAFVVGYITIWITCARAEYALNIWLVR